MKACVLATGARDKDGYGRVWYKGRTHRAHRLMWELGNGPIPEGMHVLHKCDNPPCIRPEHLFLGTNAANMADKTAKGRQVKKETHGRALLTEAQIAQVRKDYENGRSQGSLAEEYGVARTTIGRIVRQETWA